MYAALFDECSPAAELLNSLARKHRRIHVVYGSLSEDLNWWKSPPRTIRKIDRWTCRPHEDTLRKSFTSFSMIKAVEFGFCIIALKRTNAHLHCREWITPFVIKSSRILFLQDHPKRAATLSYIYNVSTYIRPGTTIADQFLAKHKIECVIVIEALRNIAFRGNNETPI